MRQSNAVTASFTNTTIDREARMMRELPESVRNWLLYDSPANYEISGVYELHQEGMSAAQILSALKSVSRSLTMKTYGSQHPSLAYAGQQLKKAA